MTSSSVGSTGATFGRGAVWTGRNSEVSRPGGRNAGVALTLRALAMFPVRLCCAIPRRIRFPITAFRLNVVLNSAFRSDAIREFDSPSASSAFIRSIISSVQTSIILLCFVVWKAARREVEANQFLSRRDFRPSAVAPVFVRPGSPEYGDGRTESDQNRSGRKLRRETPRTSATRLTCSAGTRFQQPTATCEIPSCFASRSAVPRRLLCFCHSSPPTPLNLTPKIDTPGIFAGQTLGRLAIVSQACIHARAAGNAADNERGN